MLSLMHQERHRYLSNAPVHYESPVDGVRYCVLPPDVGLTLPDETSLRAIASDENQDWARARHEETPVPEGEPDTKVSTCRYVGPWPCTPYTEETRAEAGQANEMIEHADPEEWAPAYRKQTRDFYRSCMKRKGKRAIIVVEDLRTTADARDYPRVTTASSPPPQEPTDGRLVESVI